MPGPLLGVTIDGSLRKGWLTGPIIVSGHAILEFVLIIVMTFGLKNFFSNPMVAGFIGLFGGFFLAWMGYGMVTSGLDKSLSLNSPGGSSGARVKSFVLAGVLISATNPYFILWWATTGMELIRQSLVVGLIGVLIFYIGHILSDFVWYTAVSLAFSKGKQLISDVWYRRVVLSLGIFILAFSFYFIGSGWQMLWG